MDSKPRYARVAIYRYRPGKREEGDRVVQGFIRDGAEGLEGHLMLDDLDDPDRAAYVTLWDSEEAMLTYFGSIRKDLDEAMRDLTIGTAEFVFTRIRSASRR